MQILKEVRNLKSKLLQQEQQMRPPPILEPRSAPGAYRRGQNAALKVLELIQLHNQNPNNLLKYKTFSAGTEPEMVNRACKEVLHEIMLDVLGADYGKHTWYQAEHGVLRSKCQKVIEIASTRSEFSVLTQTFNNWAIRWQASQRMKSAGRASHVKEEARKDEVAVLPLDDNLSVKNKLLPNSDLSQKDMKLSIVEKKENAKDSSATEIQPNVRIRAKQMNGKGVSGSIESSKKTAQPSPTEEDCSRSASLKLRIRSPRPVLRSRRNIAKGGRRKKER